jgi:hypothetical protein
MPKVNKKWLFPAFSAFLFLLLVAMTGCFLWQYHLPKLQTGECGAISSIALGP